jgi:hypothetical protein
MPSTISALLLTLVTLLAQAAPSTAPSNATSPAEAPATRPSAMSPDDEAAVRQAASDFANALATGDAAKARSLYAGPEANVPFIDLLANYSAALNKLASTAESKFGPASPLSRPKNPGKLMASAIAVSTCSQRGETATLSIAAGQSTLDLNRINGAWKIVGLSEFARLGSNARRISGISGVINELADEIATGKLTTSSAAEQELARRARSLTTQPATPTAPSGK